MLILMIMSNYLLVMYEQDYSCSSYLGCFFNQFRYNKIIEITFTQTVKKLKTKSDEIVISNICFCVYIGGAITNKGM